MDKNNNKCRDFSYADRLFRSVLIALFVAILLLIPARRPAPAQAARASGQTPGYAGQMETFLEAQMKRYHIPGLAVAIVRGGEVEYLQGFGTAGPDGRAVTPDMPFLLASVSKSITATAVMQLAETGKLELDDPVRAYLPWFEVSGTGGGAITIFQLLHQTTGFSEEGGVQMNLRPDGPDALEAGVRALREQKLRFQPGSDFEYSNINYAVLGLLVQQVSGQTYEDYITQHIFTPLGMSHSYTSQEAARAAGAAGGYYAFYGLPVPIEEYAYTRASLPAAGIWSSAADLSRYLLAHLDEDRAASQLALSPASLQALHAPGYRLDEVYSYGMGWFHLTRFLPEEAVAGLEGSELRNFGDLEVLAHEGDWVNYKSVAMLIPGLDFGAVLLMNVNNPAIPSAYRFMAWDAAIIATGGEAQYYPPSEAFIVQYSRWIFSLLALLLAGGLAWLAGAIRRAWVGQTPRARVLRLAAAALGVAIALFALIVLWVFPNNAVNMPILRGFAPDLWLVMVLIFTLLAGWAASGAAMIGLVLARTREKEQAQAVKRALS